MFFFLELFYLDVALQRILKRCMCLFSFILINFCLKILITWRFVESKLVGKEIYKLVEIFLTGLQLNNLLNSLFLWIMAKNKITNMCTYASHN